MTATFARAPSSALEVLREILERTHAGLPAIDATIDFLFAHAPRKGGLPVGRAMVERGQLVLGKIRITQARERVKGAADLELTVDGDAWLGIPNRLEPLTREERLALLDHELEHVEVPLSSDTGKPQWDEAMRPKLRLRPHDFEVGGFVALGHRHGIAAPEVRYLGALYHGQGGQLLFPWARTPKPGSGEPRWNDSGRYPPDLVAHWRDLWERELKRRSGTAARVAQIGEAR